MRRLGCAAAAVLVLAAADGAAEPLQPRFVARPDALPAPHVYDGGWEHFVGGGVAVFDCNGDGLPDIAAAGGVNPATLFVNRTAGPGAPLRFEAGGFPVIQGVTGLYPLDIDGDGAQDLVVLRVGANRLLRGDGACGFTDASAAWGFEGGDRWSTAFSATWEPGAAWPTFAIGNYVDRDAPDGPFGACDTNELHRAGPDGYGPPTPLAPGFCALSMLFSDWRRVGEVELRVSNDRHYYLRGGSEQMWRLGPLRLRTDDWEPVSIWGMGIASGDLTGNGYPDVMLTSMGDQLVMLNDEGSLRRAPFDLGTYAQRPHTGDDGRPSTGWHAEVADVNNDGRLDLFIAKGNVDQMPGNAMRDPNSLLVQGANGRFVELSVAAGVASDHRGRGAALADFDGDGRRDLVVVNRRAPMELWQNVTEGTGRWLGVRLAQPGSNRHALGAWVEVRSGGRVQVQEVTVGGGHAGGQAGPLHFGVGRAEAAQLRVIWPDGTRGPWQEVGLDRVVTVER